MLEHVVEHPSVANEGPFFDDGCPGDRMKLRPPADSSGHFDWSGGVRARFDRRSTRLGIGSKLVRYSSEDAVGLIWTVGRENMCQSSSDAKMRALGRHCTP